MATRHGWLNLLMGAVRRGRPALVTLTLALVAGGLAAIDGGHDHHGSARSHPITTDSREAQRLFDEGLSLAWGFNHLQAARAFRQATEADPECAMCWWGVALVLGPNINAPLDPQYYPEILDALAKAKQHVANGTEKEQAYVRALAERYGSEPVEDRSELDRAYASAMRRVANAYPDDLEAATLFAEAVMDTMPWDYWRPSGKPRQGTNEFLDVLESVLRRDATHAGANHLLIHAVEKTRPELGVPAAERLETAEQATGHLIHMASHIYIRVGRYDDAARVNAMAIADDDVYAAAHEVPPEYLPYMLHNHHMRWAALALDGQHEAAAEEASYLAGSVDPEMFQLPAVGIFLQHLTTIPTFTDIGAGNWEAVLAVPEPAAELVYPRAIRHFARGLALLRNGDTDAAGGELQALRKLAADPSLAEVNLGFNATTDLLAIAENVLAGELAAAAGDRSRAVRHLREAVRREDGLTYDEPPPWLPPTRNSMGGVLLAIGRPAEAEKAFRQDLEMYPDNGWSVDGLERALEAQGKQAPGSSEDDTVSTSG